MNASMGCWTWPLNNLMVICNAPCKILQIVSKTSFKVSLAETPPAISPHAICNEGPRSTRGWLEKN